MQSANQWKLENGYLTAPEFGYDISFERLKDGHLIDHMAEKTWCDIPHLKAMIETCWTTINTADDDNHDMGESR